MPRWVRSVLRLAVALVACGLAGSAAAARGAEGWKAGAARVEITPEAPMWMAGYAARDHVAEGKLTPLWAKALVLEDAAGRRAALVTLDLVGIGRDLSLEIRAALESRYGLKREAVALNCSHTHCGPVVANNLRPLHAILPPEQWTPIVAYRDRLAQQVIDVVGRALDDLAPCELQWGEGRATFAVNRRNNKEPEVPALRARGELVGPSDHSVPVLLATRDGKPRAILFGYACHATVLSFYQWCGDYPGYAQAALEAAYPGAVALFFAGCGGDQNPLPRRTVELAERYGQHLAHSVGVVLQGELRPIRGPLTTAYREIDLPLGTLPTRAELQAQAEKGNKYEQARARLLLEQLEAGEPLAKTYPYPIQTWQLGDGPAWVSLGGEVVVDYALRIKAELSPAPTWVAGYTNDVCAYIPSRRVLGEGGYEGATSMVYYGLPTTWAPQLEDAIVSEVRRQAGK